MKGKEKFNGALEQMEVAKVLEFKIAKLRLSKGDTLVVKVPAMALEAASEHLGVIMKKAFPEIGCLILPKDLDIEVVEPPPYGAS